ncbi:MAG: HNH endonuclease [Anaerolineae bacterium]|nr:HNH endonuclease [Anaerolineae bacterium]
MLKVECPPLPTNLRAYLDRQQARANPWKSLAGSKPAREVKHALVEVFHHKCGYCERIEAQTVDHFVPQTDLQARWDWENFVLACDVCQSKKLGRQPQDVQGRQMVNPRHDEPLHFLYFDFETGAVTPMPTSEETLARGRITTQLLGFDQRAALQDERRRRFLEVIGCILRIVQPQSPQDAAIAWDQLVDHLKAEAPYLGMIRQFVLKPNRYTPLLETLREARPDFDALIAYWCLPLD